MLWNNAKAAARGSHGGSQLKIVRVAICTQEIENAPKTGISFICIIFSSLIDPAVGSGAFPLGMLNEIVKARNTLTSYMAIEKNSRQRKDLYIERNPYRFKRETIRDCIFACDIEPSAVDITKLRLWLSLVIDDQIMEIDDIIMDSSTKPRELPNLDCNIICGNSLLDEFMGEKLITKSSALNNLGEYYQGTLYDESVYQTINEIIALQRKLYDEKDHVEKNSLKRQI